MTPIQIPTDMPYEQINSYVQGKLKMTSQANIVQKDAPKEIPPEPTFRNTIEIQGDDWTTDSKGMSGKSLKRLITKIKKS